MGHNLPNLRQQIDVIDAQLLKLLGQRAQIAQQVGEVKKQEGLPFFQPERVASVIEKIQKNNPTALKNQHIAAIWREIMSACLALEAPMRVAYLGPAGTFSEQAALQFFGASIEHVACGSIDEVFLATTAGRADYGVVPVENSTEGVVSRSLDLFLNSPVHIIGEVSLMVQHHLLRLHASLEDVQVVYAHPQALAQCHAWLNSQLPHAERRAASSNAQGAQLAATNPAWASIASERAAGVFGLHVAAHAIQDEAFNRTRFAVVCLPQTLPLPAASAKDCISLVVSVPNQSGAVYGMLEPLKNHGVSMTRLESRPARSGQWDYYFYIDLQGHPSQPHVGQALEELKRTCSFFKMLGVYPLAE